jgi:hypothetical protein
MKWSDVDISFGPGDHPETELSERNFIKAIDQAAQGGQDTNQQWGFIKSYHEENLH